jgi:hypothetical protein
MRRLPSTLFTGRGNRLILATGGSYRHERRRMLRPAPNLEEVAMHSKTLMKAFMMTAAAMLVTGASQPVAATPLIAGAFSAPETRLPVESVHYYGYGRGYYGYGRGYYGGYYGRGYYGYGRGYYGYGPGYYWYGPGYYGYGRGYYGGYRYY